RVRAARPPRRGGGGGVVRHGRRRRPARAGALRAVPAGAAACRGRARAAGVPRLPAAATEAPLPHPAHRPGLPRRRAAPSARGAGASPARGRRAQGRRGGGRRRGARVAVGILGGAFDPPHLGHVALARAAIEHFRLERLLVRVVAAPGHKQVVAPAEARLELARLAFADVAQAEVALDRHGRTVDSLEELSLDDPVFLIGADELVSFATWKEPERVLALARLGVATRPGFPPARLERALASL